LRLWPVRPPGPLFFWPAIIWRSWRLLRTAFVWRHRACEEHRHDCGLAVVCDVEKHHLDVFLVGGNLVDPPPESDATLGVNHDVWSALCDERSDGRLYDERVLYREPPARTARYRQPRHLRWLGLYSVSRAHEHELADRPFTRGR